jgi:RimJ/RimL family protein N-acetyltransferase
MNSYKVLSKQKFSNNEFTIVPIRFKDRMDILQWRNEQVYHLRQEKPLTEEDQENYFNNIVSKLFHEEKPNQILFSYLKDTICIGYGGLVHINWIDKNAEISFIMNTKLEKEEFSKHWITFLKLIEQVAFHELSLYKIFTFAFDLRPHLYAPIEASGFLKEARLKKHYFFNGSYKDVIIHSKFNKNNHTII